MAEAGAGGAAGSSAPSGAGDGGALRVPRLQAAGYAAWRPLMEVFLRRLGVTEKDFKVPNERWAALVAEVARWSAEEEDSAIALVLGHTAAGAGPGKESAQTASSAGGSTPQKALAGAWKVKQEEAAAAMEHEARVRAARKLAAASVERSERAYYYLLNAMPEALHPLVRTVPQGYAFGLWDFLEKRFQNTEDDNVADLFQRWNDLAQTEQESFDAYKARVDEAYTLLTHAKEKPSVRQYSYTLLDKLQPHFKQAVLALKASGQLKDPEKISWDSVVSFINTQERSEQRLAGPDGERNMAARRLGKTSYRDSVGSAPPRVPTAAASESQGGGHRPAPPRLLADVQCFSCGQFGHLQRRCPKGKGSAQESHSAPKQRPMARSGDKGTAATKQEGKAAVGTGSKSSSPTRSSGGEHASAVVRASRNRFEAISGDDHSPDAESDDEAPAAPAQFETTLSTAGQSVSGRTYAATARRESSGEILKKEQPQAGAKAATDTKGQDLGAALATSTWGVDTMASVHCSGNRKLFTSLASCAPMSVELADGSLVTAQQRGKVQLRMREGSGGKPFSITVDGVYYHPSFAANLLSMMRLVGKEGWELHATKSDPHLLTPGGIKVKLTTRGNVATLDNECGHSPERAFQLSGEASCGTVHDLVRLHQRLGHMGFDRLVQVCRRGTTMDVGRLAVSYEDLQRARQIIMNCEACARGKGTRKAFGHAGLDRGSQPLEVLHMDTYEVRLPENKVEYGLVISDPYSEWRFFGRQTSKATVASEVVGLIQRVQAGLGRKVKRLHTDGGSEFINGTLKDFCQKNGTELHWTPARTQQLNGIAERHVRSSKDGTRTLMQACGLPDTYWWYAAMHHTHVWNRTRIAAATGVTPHESFYGKPPSVKYLGVFGCDAFIHVPKEHRATFGAKMEPGIYLGHDWTQDAPRLLLLSTGRTVVSRDVRFREDSFGHAHALSGRQGAPQPVEVLVDAPTVMDSRGHTDVRSESAPGSGNHAAAGAGDQGSSNQQTVFEVEKLTGKRIGPGGRVEYRVKWAGYADEEATWEPAAELRRTARACVDAFNRQLRVTDGISPAGPDHEAQPAATQQSSAVTMEPDAAAEGPPVQEPQPISPVAQMLMCTLGRDLRAENQPWHEMERRRAMACAIQQGVGLLEERTPKTHAEAMRGPDHERWKAAEQKEWNSCVSNDTWVLVPRESLPPRANVIRCKTVYKIKVNEHGQVVEYKARFTPKGFMQREGIDFFEVFAPTGQYKTMRVGLSITAELDHELDQMDVPSAFLKAPLDEDVYMEIPDGFREGREGMVLHLKKSLYGLKQAPRNWYLTLRTFVTGELGYKATVSDPCLFWRRSASGRLMLLFVFVDDFQSSYNRADAAEWNELKRKLVERYGTKDVGPSRWILGMSIVRDRKARTIHLGQELYVTKALEKYGLANCRPVATPEQQGMESEPDGAKADRQRYQEVVGTLLYAAISTRPDIAHAVHQLTRHMQEPCEKHMAAAMRVLRYLSGTRQWCLQFGGRRGGVVKSATGGDLQGTPLTVEISAFADADYAGAKSDRRSVTGWVAKLNGDPISWAAKKQSVVSQSSCEAELYAEAAAVNEVLWVRGLMKELGLMVRDGSIVHGDNESTLTISRNGIKSERTKHVDVKYHFVTDCISRGIVDVKWVPTEEQQADIFTKALDRAKFEKHRLSLMAPAPGGTAPDEQPLARQH